MSDEGSIIHATLEDMRATWTVAERARIVEQLRFLADARKDYCHSCPQSADAYHTMDAMALAVHEEHAAASWLADIIEGTNTGQGWLPSWRWLEWKELREGDRTSNETPASVGSTPPRSNERGAVETIEAVRRLFNIMSHIDYDGQVSMGFMATFDQHLDAMLEEATGNDNREVVVCDTASANPSVVGEDLGHMLVQFPGIDLTTVRLIPRGDDSVRIEARRGDR